MSMRDVDAKVIPDDAVVTITRSRLVEIIDSHTSADGVIQADPATLVDEIFLTHGVENV